MLYLFIDSNIFLSFYHFSNEDLEELRKLVVLLEQKKVWLLLPEQVIDEFKRNRESKILDAVKRVGDQKLNNEFPQIYKEYDEYAIMRENIQIYSKQKSLLEKKLMTDIQNKNLKADQIIQSLFNKAQRIPFTPDILNRAKIRFDRGNPPGKDNSYGDAIIWESLLDTNFEDIDDSDEFHFICDDKDFRSPINLDSFNSFLEDEWEKFQKIDLTFHRSLSSFFREKFPEIKLASQLEKDILTERLINSGSFASTRAILQKLVKHSDFTPAQVNNIVQAALTNNQVYWIAEDEDISDYIFRLITPYEHLIDPADYKTIFEKYNFIPF